MIQYIQKSSDTFSIPQTDLFAPCPLHITVDFAASECLSLLEPSPFCFDFTKPYHIMHTTLLPDGDTYHVQLYEYHKFTPPLLADITIAPVDHHHALIQGEVHVLLNQHYVMWVIAAVMTMIFSLLFVLNGYFGVGLGIILVVLVWLSGNIWTTIRQQRGLINQIKTLFEV
ncbi:MAG: hypothetical protein CUN56_06450 [Phototrophicales bacterium]|nr:MAG: hypothetical protein CUN56_06450 [Phototrophicales bacterium]RMG75282.1 MAG: hypothetical protein D6711_06925 [Chloroflexota bacterium]